MALFVQAFCYACYMEQGFLHWPIAPCNFPEIVSGTALWVSRAQISPKRLSSPGDRLYLFRPWLKQIHKERVLGFLNCPRFCDLVIVICDLVIVICDLVIVILWCRLWAKCEQNVSGMWAARSGWRCCTSMVPCLRLLQMKIDVYCRQRNYTNRSFISAIEWLHKAAASHRAFQLTEAAGAGGCWSTMPRFE